MSRTVLKLDTFQSQSLPMGGFFVSAVSKYIGGIALALFFASYLIPFHSSPLPQFWQELSSGTAIALLTAAILVRGLEQARAADRFLFSLKIWGLIIAILTSHGIISVLFREADLGQFVIQSTFLLLSLAAFFVGFFGSSVSPSSHVHTLNSKANVVAAVLVVFVILGAINLSIALYQMTSLQFLSGLIIDVEGTRPLSNIGQPNHAALFAAISWSSCLIAATKLRSGYLINLALFTVFSIGIFIFQSRTSIVFSAIAVGCLVLKRDSCFPSRIWIPAVFSLVLGYVLINFAIIDLFSALAEQELERQFNSGVSNRTALYLDALKASFSKPWLGWGFWNVAEANFYVSSGAEHSLYHRDSHNFALNLLIVYGWPIGILLLVLLTAAIVKAFVYSKSPLQAGLLLSILAILTHGTTGVVISHLYTILPLFLFLGASSRARNASTEVLLQRTPRSSIALNLFSAALLLITLICAVVIGASYTRMQADYYRSFIRFNGVQDPKYVGPERSSVLFKSHYELIEFFDDIREARFKDGYLLEKVSSRYSLKPVLELAMIKTGNLEKCALFERLYKNYNRFWFRDKISIPAENFSGECGYQQLEHDSGRVNNSE